MKIFTGNSYELKRFLTYIYILFLSIYTNIMNFIPKFGLNRIINKSSITSNFVASLELAKNGLIEVKQNETFGNIFIRSKTI